MRNLINFLIRYSTGFIFIFYVLISVILLFLSHSYHRSVWLTSASAVSSTIYNAGAEVSGYFHLKSINESLQKSNAMLENEVLNLKYQLAQYETIYSDSLYLSDINRFGYISATVVNNSIRHPRNYFSINKGTTDGIKPGMGVVNQDGVVGIVNVAGPHSARIISLLNESQHFSVKIKDSQYAGSLVWKGHDPSIAYVEEIPRHAKYNSGDTIVTSGYSMTFPEGIPVGVIMNRVKGKDDNFFILKVRLTPNFKTLSAVRVIDDTFKEELDSLQTFDTNFSK